MLHLGLFPNFDRAEQQQLQCERCRICRRPRCALSPSAHRAELNYDLWAGLPDVTTETSSIPSSTTTPRTPASTTPASDKTGAQSPTESQTSPVAQQPSRNVGAIVGGVIGALIGLLLVGALVLYIILRHRRQASRDSQSLDTGDSRTPAVRELSGLQPPVYHVPTLKGGEVESMRGLYVRSPMPLKAETLTHNILAMLRTRMIRARTLRPGEWRWDTLDSRKLCLNSEDNFVEAFAGMMYFFSRLSAQNDTLCFCSSTSRSGWCEGGVFSALILFVRGWQYSNQSKSIYENMLAAHKPLAQKVHAWY